MDRAYVARRMTEAPRVLVVESGRQGGELGPIARRLAADTAGQIDVVEPDVHDIARPTPSRVLERAMELLDREVHHLVLLDLAPLVADPGSTTDIEELAVWLARATAKNPTTDFVLLAPLPRPGDPVATLSDYELRLRATWAEVRVDLAARELDGVTWGRAGPFRAELLKVVKAAREGGYDPFGRPAPQEDTFLERGFRRAAETRDLARRMQPAVSPELAAKLGGTASFELPATVLGWPRAETDEGAPEAVAALMDRARSLAGRPWMYAELKRNGETVVGPPLEAWLTALSFSKLGVNEFSARLPFFLLGLFALIAFFSATLKVFGPGTATLSSLVLATTPLFYAAARSTSGSLTATASLTFVAAGLMGVAARSRLSIGATWLVALGAAGLLYSQGVVGFALAALLAALVPAVLTERRPVAWIPALVLVPLSGWLVWRALHGDLPPEFGPKMPLFSWDLRMEDRPVFLNYDDMLKQIGFGSLPWAALLPLAVGALAARPKLGGEGGLDPTARGGVLALLWVAVPFAVLGAAQKWTNHLIYPAIPGVALLVGLYLHAVFTGQRKVTALDATVFALITVVLLNDLRKSPEPATTFLTADPPLVGIKEDSDYPEVVKLPSMLLAALAVALLLVVAHGTRAVERVRAILHGLTSARGLAISAIALGGMLSAWWLLSLQGQIADVFTTPGGQMLETIHRLYVRDVFYWRPHHWALLAIAGVPLLVVTFGPYRLGHRILGWLRTWVFTRLTANTLALGAGLAAVATGVGKAEGLPVAGWLLAVGFGLSRGLLAPPARFGFIALAGAVALIPAAPLAGLGLALAAGLLGVFELATLPRLAARLVLAIGVGVLAESPLALVLALMAASADAVAVLGVLRGRQAQPLNEQLDGLGAVASLMAPLLLAVGAAWATPHEALAWVVGAAAGAALAPWLLSNEQRPQRAAAVVVAFGAAAALSGQWGLLLALPLAASGLAVRLLVPAATRAAQAVGRLVSQYVDGGPRLALGHAVLALLCAGAALGLVLTGATYDDGAVVALTIASPWVIGCVCALVGLAVARVLAGRLPRERFDGASGPTRALALLARDHAPVAALWLLTALLAGAAAQLFVDSPLTRARFLAIPLPLPAESQALFAKGQVISGLIAAAGLLFALAQLPWLLGRGQDPALPGGARRSTVRRSFALAAAALAALICLMVTALARKWLQLEPLADPSDAGFLTYLATRSRVSLVVYASTAALGAIAAFRYRQAIFESLARRGYRLEWLALGVGLLAGAGAGAALGVPRGAAAALGALGVVAALLPLAPTVRRLTLSLLGQAGGARRGLIAAGALIAGAGAIVGGLCARPPALGALVALPVGLGLALLYRRRPLSAEGAITSTGGAMGRGALEICVAALAYAAPVATALALGAEGSVRSALALGVGLLVLLLVIHALVIGFRLGVGLSDVLGRLSVGAPAAIFFALAGVAASALLARPTTSTSLPLVAGGALLFCGGAFLLLTGLQGGAGQALASIVQRPPAFVVALVAAALGVSAMFNTRLVAALSLHVSQKHLLDSIREREGGELPEGRVFQHGLTGQSERNFYTGSIPEVRDASAALRVLQGVRDEVVSVKRGGSTIGQTVVMRGFAPNDDKDGDGHRDEPATAGVYTELDLEASPPRLVDPQAHWSDGQWANAILVDSDGWRYPVVSNGSNHLEFDVTGARAPETLTAKTEKRTGPPFDPTAGVRNAYRVVTSEALDVTSTGMNRERLYFLLPKVGTENPGRSDRGSFSTLNHEYRKLTGGQHLAVLDDRSSRILLASSWLAPGDVDKNPIKSSLIDETEMVRLLASGEARGAPAKAPLSAMATWDEGVSLVGYSVDPWVVQRGRKFTLRLYFQVQKPLKESFKLFVHCDRGSSRVHTDHWPNAVSQGKEGKHCVGCFQTDHWMPGDIVVDTYERDIPFGTPAGETDIFMGFFNPDDNDKRLSVTSWNDKLVRHTNNDNRPRIGSFVVR